MCRLYGEHPTSHHELPEALRDPSMAFDTLRWPSIPFDGLRYHSMAFDTLRDPSIPFEALRTLAKPVGPLPLLRTPSPSTLVVLHLHRTTSNSLNGSSNPRGYPG